MPYGVDIEPLFTCNTINPKSSAIREAIEVIIINYSFKHQT